MRKPHIGPQCVSFMVRSARHNEVAQCSCHLWVSINASTSQTFTS